MNYRDAKYDDYQIFLDIGKKIHSLSVYNNMSFSQRKVFTLFASYLENKSRFFCKIAESNSKPAGVIFGKLMAPVYSEQLMACDVFFWVESSIRKNGIATNLIDLFIGWALANKAKYIQLQNGAGIINDLSNLFDRSGLIKTGELYGVSA